MIALRTLTALILVSLSAVSCRNGETRQDNPREDDGTASGAPGGSRWAVSDTPRPGAGEPWVDGTELWLAPLESEGTADAGFPRLGEGRNITGRAGYDNQPEFAPDGTVLYTLGVADRTDIWRYDPATDAHAPVTATPDQSEYSATPMPGWEGGSGALSIIRVEPDSAQRLWAIDLRSPPPSRERVLLPDIRPVGYHAWVNDSVLALFVLGDPATLQRARPGSGGGEVVAEGIGRGIERIPGEEAVSYTVVRDGGNVLRRYGADGTDGPLPLGVSQLPGPDHAWTPGGLVIHGAGHRLYALRPGGDGPREIGVLPDEALTISRLAVSPDGRWIVLVVEREEG